MEFAVESIRDGKPRDFAIIDAGMKRARPIVMTTIAMAAGMMPSALAFGAGGEFRSPMALAVIGGLAFSTVLSLVFVPAMFMLMDDIGALFWRFGKKLLVSSGEGKRRRGMVRRASRRRRASCIRRRRSEIEFYRQAKNGAPEKMGPSLGNSPEPSDNSLTEALRNLL